jgi:serine/threonine protein kinase
MRRASTPANYRYCGSGQTADRAGRSRVLTCACPEAIADKADAWRLSMFQIDRLLGKGVASRVYSAKFIEDGTPLALKTYIKAKMSPLNVHHVRREIDIHSRISHENVVDMWGAFEDDERFVILMELGKGDLKDLVDMGGGKLGEQATADVMRQVLSALEHVHAMNIAHRDVKPENVVVATDGTLKLADFGLSIDLSKERAVTRVGTLALMAPEVLACPCKVAPSDNKSREDLWYGVKADTWSCGVMAYELMTCKHLFDGPTTASTMFAITYRHVSLPTWMSDDAQRFIKRALSRQQIFRPTAGWLLHHDFLRGQALPQGAGLPP